MSSLTPELALAYVRELSADFRAGIVLDKDGERLAGDPRLRAPAKALLDAYPHAREFHGTTTGDGTTTHEGTNVFAARGEDVAIVVVAGRHALPGVMRRDLRTVLSGNAGESGQEPPFERPESRLLTALATASADAFRP